MRRFLSFESINFKSAKFQSSETDEWNQHFARSRSLENIHLNVNSSWFMNNKLTRSKSLDNHVNNVNNQANLKMPQSSSELQMNSKTSSNFKLIQTKLIDDHSLPSSISDELFNILMRYEKNRLRTFKDWQSKSITPAELSQAGFYYLLQSELVKCFECTITLFNWETGDKAIIEHYKNSPKCRLLNGYSVGNVPINKTPLDLLREYLDLEEFRPVKPSEDVLIEFDNLDDDEELEILNENALSFNREDKQKNSTLSSAYNQLSFSEQQFFELMKSEENRLKTFNTWPEYLVDKIRPGDLAKCGFFYTLIRDKVLCAFCKTPAWDWALTDVPIKEHYKHNSDCPLLNDEECGPYYSSESYSDDDIIQFIHNSNTSQNNQTINSNQTTFDLNSNESIDLNELTKLKKLQKVILTHKHVEKYYTYKNRLDTFDNWPLKSCKRDRLAKAGFYYTGLNYQVKCFSCDLVLTKWSDNDDPWIEHCKFSSECEYLKLEKGNDFIARNSQQKNSPKIQVTCSGSTASSASSNSSSDIENEGSINFDEDIKHTCKICMVKEANVVFLPCTHLMFCASCTMLMKACPLCKEEITSTMKIFIS